MTPLLDNLRIPPGEPRMPAIKKSRHHSASSPPRYLFAAEDNTDDRSEHVCKNKYTHKTSRLLT